MATITFSADELVKYGLPKRGYDGVEVILDQIVDQSRWSIFHDIIFKWTDGKYYSTGYSEGATECQEEAPWEYEDEVECVEVHQVEKMVKVWEAV
ncbi:hypothetical protein [Brevibacillus laterosporus]|uniref:Uncharacterized protein n=1 Tax=Brevibacillus laterosporus TaxID=1465 RepID=A0AAP3GA43_BRELA|nr:hypothetical protein [Brevibacillus laterosporus]MCR8983057.1 hypothetical protein [Brevibacillus laterosporus]MCZ0810213.1 hypothetical protein [Brevibacillus laterosporus]MCZ0828871.1 hypothetical protein [Brevibacillus laterosporus]MCZ0852930.1 hypothetical protein [Brevibacillus laterosporus]